MNNNKIITNNMQLTQHTLPIIEQIVTFLSLLTHSFSPSGIAYPSGDFMTYAALS